MSLYAGKIPKLKPKAKKLNLRYARPPISIMSQSTRRKKNAR